MSADAKSPAIHAEPAFRKGLIEIQDEGSQLAALFAGAKPGEQVIDLAAGAGGKTLALAAAMENRGQIYATDIDKRQLVPIHERIARAGARNIQVRTPRGESDMLTDLVGRADLVLIDAPCTGTGTWRRNPDAKWRIRPGALAERVKQQAALLDRAVALTKPGAASPTSPARCSTRRMATRCGTLSGVTLIFPWKSRPNWPRRWASAPIFLPARRLSPTKVC